MTPISLQKLFDSPIQSLLAESVYYSHLMVQLQQDGSLSAATVLASPQLQEILKWTNRAMEFLKKIDVSVGKLRKNFSIVDTVIVDDLRERVNGLNNSVLALGGQDEADIGGKSKGDMSAALNINTTHEARPLGLENTEDEGGVAMSAALNVNTTHEARPLGLENTEDEGGVAMLEGSTMEDAVKGRVRKDKNDGCLVVRNQDGISCDEETGFVHARVPACKRCIALGRPCIGAYPWSCDACTRAKRPCEDEEQSTVAETLGRGKRKRRPMVREEIPPPPQTNLKTRRTYNKRPFTQVDVDDDPSLPTINVYRSSKRIRPVSVEPSTSVTHSDLFTHSHQTAPCDPTLPAMFRVLTADDILKGADANGGAAGVALMGKAAEMLAAAYLASEQVSLDIARADQMQQYGWMEMSKGLKRVAEGWNKMDL